MNLSQSAHFDHIKKKQKNKSYAKLNKAQENDIRRKQIRLNAEVIEVLVKLGKQDQLEPIFIDNFASLILDNNIFDFYAHYGDVRVITYQEFYQTLKNLSAQFSKTRKWRESHHRINTLQNIQKSNFKKAKSSENIRKASVDVQPLQDIRSYEFTFQSHNNSITLLLDLSPHMLLYDYSTKSFVLQNLQQVIKDLFVGLQHHYKQRKNGDSGPSYTISCYAFSINQLEVEEVMRQQQILFGDIHSIHVKNKDLIVDYICTYVNRSRLPHTSCHSQAKTSTIQTIQKVLNLQEGSSGMRTFITISSFKENNTQPFVFYSSHWYTFCFICPGSLNFGSYLIDDSQIFNKIPINTFFETKFVFKCKFLQNWQKVHLIQQEGFQFKYLDSSVQKSRAILYMRTNGEKRQSVFEDILKFKLKLGNRKKRNEGMKSNQSVISAVKNQKLPRNHEMKFSVPIENISEIMRTKYLQGWTQLSTENYVHSSKYSFKLQFSDKQAIFYIATRQLDNLDIRISYLTNQSENDKKSDNDKRIDKDKKIEKNQIQKDNMKKQRIDILKKVRKIDLINTSTFDAVINFKSNNISLADIKFKKTQINELRKINKKNKNWNFQQRMEKQQMSQQTRLFADIMDRHNEWSSYFKVRKIYLQFNPNESYFNDLNELLNQFGYLLGQRISHLCFMQRKEKKQKFYDTLKQRQISRWNVIFVKVSGIFHFLQFKFGFLKYTDAQSKQTIQLIQNKLISKKLMNGSIKIIPQDIYHYCIQQFGSKASLQKSIPSVFQRNWKIGFKNQQLSKVFRNMNIKIIKKLGFNFLYSKLNALYYFKMLHFVSENVKKQKCVFLKIIYENTNNTQFKIQVFPSFAIIQQVLNKQGIQSFSEKNIYQLTTKSISSSNSQQSLVSSISLPIPSTIASQKDINLLRNNPNFVKFKSFLELFSSQIQQLKQTQRKLVNLIRCYSQIYQYLIRKRLQQKKSAIQNEQLIQKIKELYRLSGDNFETEYLLILQTIKKEHYNQQYQQNISSKGANRRTIQKGANHLNPASLNQHLQLNIDQIPQPKDYLIQSSISNLKGDLTLTSKSIPQKKYTFFLLTPNRIMYLWKKTNSQKIYFRCINSLYFHTSFSEKQQIEMKQAFQKQLKQRINKQLKQEHYLSFYNIIAQQLPQSNSSPNYRTSLTTRRKQSDCQPLKSIVTKNEQNISSFIGVSLDCGQIYNILSKQQNKYLQPRMIKILVQFRKKLFEYISVFFQKSKLELKQSKLKIADYQAKKVASDSRNLKQVVKKQAKNQNQIIFQDIIKQKSEQKSEIVQRLNNYFFQKKNLNLEDQQLQKYNFKNVQQLNGFQNIILKICTNTNCPITPQNFINLFTINKQKQLGKNSSQQLYLTKKTQIIIQCFSYKATKFSNKIFWLNGILQEVLTQCVIYLNLTTMTQPTDIKDMESKLSDHICRGPAVKIPDQMWKQNEIIGLIQSGHMRNFIPFYQYSNKPFPAKFIAREIQNVPSYFTPVNKPNQIINLKYWLTMQLTPAKVLKTRLILFKHITLATQIIVNMSKGNYDSQFHQMIDKYMQELFKFMKVRTIFKNIQTKLMFPLDPLIPLFINYKIFKKLEQQKKKLLKNKIPKKFKNRPPNLQLKSVSTIGPDSGMNSSFLNSMIDSNNPNQLISKELANTKDMFKMPMIYQGTINYYPKFQPDQILSCLACCEKLNPNAIRNLDNTYIFFNPEFKEYFIFYLEQSKLPTLQSSFLNQTYTPKIELIGENQKQNERATFHIDNNHSQQYPTQRTKSELPLMGVNTQDSFIQKKKNNTLIYSFYCVDKTIPITQIQKLHEGLIKKAIKQVTYNKISKYLYYNASIIDQTEQQYFKQGEKKTFSFKVPYIEHRNSLRQYFKQHLQIAFQHKKTELKSQIKAREMNRQIDGEDSPQIRKNNRNDAKISSKKVAKKQLKHESHCSQRCNPQTWIFNTTQNKKLEEVFGNCMYLMSIKMIDNVDSAENALFWKRQVKQNLDNCYIYPDMPNKQSEALNDDKNCYNQKDLQKHLLRYNQRQTNFKKIQHQSASDIALSNSSQFLFTQPCKTNAEQSIVKSQQEHLRTISLPLTLEVLTQNNNLAPLEPQKYTKITIQIISYFGNPKFETIYNSYQQLIYQSIYDYYFENKIFKQLIINFNINFKSPKYKKNKFFNKQRSISKTSGPVIKLSQNQSNIIIEQQEGKSNIVDSGPSLQRVQSTPISSSSVAASFHGIPWANDYYVNDIYEALLNFFQVLQKKFSISKTQSMILYKTQNKVLIQQKLPPLKNFIHKINEVFLKAAKNIEKYTYKLIIYGMDRNTNLYYFWEDQFQKTNPELKKSKSLIFQNIQNDIIKDQLDLIKVGVFFIDSLLDLDHLCKQFLLKDQSNDKQQVKCWQTCSRADNKVSIQFQWLKRYQEGRAFCQTQFLFKRSILLHHQISDSQFLFYCYNFKQHDIDQFLIFLKEQEIWFSEKYRLFNFISKIKKQQKQQKQDNQEKQEKNQQQNRYEIPPSTVEIPIIKNSYMDFKYLDKEHPTSTTKRAAIDHQQFQINLTKLLISLIFDDLPFKNFMKSGDSIKKMYNILSKKTVPYNLYPEYKGKQKSKLIKIGKQYLSILRYNYGFQKPIRKQSQIAQRKSVRKNTDKP